MRMKLKNMYWQIIDFKIFRWNLKGYAEIATDPSVLRQISDKEVSIDEINNATNPMEAMNRLENEMSRQQEIDALTRSRRR